MRRKRVMECGAALVVSLGLLCGCSGAAAVTKAAASEEVTTKAAPEETAAETAATEAAASETVTTEAAAETTAAEASAAPGACGWTWSELQENVSKDTVTAPGDDFHLYVNKDWILNNKIPEGHSVYSKYEERQEYVDKQYMALLEDESLHTELAGEVQSTYRTILDWDARNKLGYEPLKKELEEIDGIRSLDDLYQYIEDTKESYRSPLFSYYVGNDLENSEDYILMLDQSGLLLGDAAEYSNRTSNGQLRYDVKLKVLEYMLPKLGKDREEAKTMLESAIAFESGLAEVSFTTADQYADDFYEKILNKMTVDEVCTLSGGYPLRDVLKSIGMEDTAVIDVTNPEYFKALPGIVTEKNLEGIKNRYRINAITGSCTCLDEDTYRDCTKIINDAYGVKGTVPDEEMAYEAVKTIMPIQSQQFYVEQFGSEKQRELVTETCRQVIGTYQKMLSGNDYLSEATRNKAIEKLNAITIHSLYPDRWPDVSGCDLSGLSYYDAIEKCNKFSTEYNLAKAGTKVDRELWIDIGGIDILECNAFYSPSDNSINMMIGMMGDPFYNDQMSTEEIYASLGAFWIGHEISHAFDSGGSQFDKDGNYSDWWTEEDKAAYKKRIRKVDDYLSAIKIGDYFVNGSNVDTEMVADVTGLQCAIKMAEDVENFDYDKFFTTYGQMNVSISTKEVEVSQLLTDSHPLNYLRTNVPVQQFEQFYDTYQVKEGDGMYLAPEDRLLVW